MLHMAMYTCSVDSCDGNNNFNGAIIGAVVGVDCVAIIIMVITNIMIWIYYFRKRHHTGMYVPTPNTITKLHTYVVSDT